MPLGRSAAPETLYCVGAKTRRREHRKHEDSHCSSRELLLQAFPWEEASVEHGAAAHGWKGRVYAEGGGRFSKGAVNVSPGSPLVMHPRSTLERKGHGPGGVTCATPWAGTPGVKGEDGYTQREGIACDSDDHIGRRERKVTRNPLRSAWGDRRRARDACSQGVSS